MKYLKYILPLLLAACAIDPKATDSYTGLGTSPVGQRLRFSLFLGESTVDDSIRNLVNVPEVLSQPDVRIPLQNFGFKCDPAPSTICSYDGSAKSVISSIDRKDVQRFQTNIHIDAVLEKDKIDIRSKITKVTF